MKVYHFLLIGGVCLLLGACASGLTTVTSKDSPAQMRHVDNTGNNGNGTGGGSGSGGGDPSPTPDPTYPTLGVVAVTAQWVPPFSGFQDNLTPTTPVAHPPRTYGSCLQSILNGDAVPLACGPYNIAHAGCPKDGIGFDGSPMNVGDGFVPKGGNNASPPPVVYVNNVNALQLGQLIIGWLYEGSDGQTYYQIQNIPGLQSAVQLTFGPLTFSIPGKWGAQSFTAPQPWQGNTPVGTIEIMGWPAAKWAPTKTAPKPTSSCPMVT